MDFYKTLFYSPALYTFSMCMCQQSNHVLGIKCSTLHVEGKPVMVTMDYKMDVESLSQEYGRTLMQERLVSSGVFV